MKKGTPEALDEAHALFLRAIEDKPWYVPASASLPWSPHRTSGERDSTPSVLPERDRRCTIVTLRDRFIEDFVDPYLALSSMYFRYQYGGDDYMFRCIKMLWKLVEVNYPRKEYLTNLGLLLHATNKEGVCALVCPCGVTARSRAVVSAACACAGKCKSALDVIPLSELFHNLLSGTVVVFGHNVCCGACFRVVQSRALSHVICTPRL